MLGVCRMLSKNTGFHIVFVRTIMILFLIGYFWWALLMYIVLGLFVTPEDRL
jgi:phage shock protein PspC (stress-responsive transcriptional regulator)